MPYDPGFTIDGQFGTPTAGPGLPAAPIAEPAASKWGRCPKCGRTAPMTTLSALGMCSICWLDAHKPKPTTTEPVEESAVEPVTEPVIEPVITPTAPSGTTIPAPPATTEPADMSPYFEAGEMLTAPMSEYEQQALDMLSALAGQLGGMVSPHETPYGQQVGSALSSLLSGEFPEEYFKTSIEAPAQKRLEEVTLPATREAYVGPGTFWGGERAEAERRAGTDLDATLAAIRGELGYKARQQALAALGPGMEYMEMPLKQQLGQMAGISSFMGAGALPRLIEQHGLDIAYQEFIRTRPENQPYAQMLLSMLGIPMMASYAPEQPESPLAPLASAAGSLLPLLWA